MGHFKEKRRACRSCGVQWTGHEEKESDVAMATQLVADAFQDRFDRALILTADSDIAPAIRIVKIAFPTKSLDVIAPPGRFTHARSLAPKLVITPGRLAKVLLPETVANSAGSSAFLRPSKQGRCLNRRAGWRLPCRPCLVPALIFQSSSSAILWRACSARASAMAWRS